MSEDKIDSQLRRYFRRRRQVSDSRSWRCPDDLGLAAFVDETLPDRQKVKFHKHLQNCTYCQQQVAFLLKTQELPAEVHAPAELVRRTAHLNEPVPPGRWLLAYGAPVAAVAFLAIVAVTLLVPWPPFPPGGTLTEAVRGSEHRDFSLLAPVDGLVVENFPVEFRWVPVRDSFSYEVRVASLNGDLVWREQTGDTTIHLARQPEFEDGRAYYAYVRAYLPGGKVIRSGVVKFRVGRPGDTR